VPDAYERVRSRLITVRRERTEGAVGSLEERMWPNITSLSDSSLQAKAKTSGGR
jgi:hypothetical protein